MIALITDGVVTNVVLGTLADFPQGRLVGPGERVSPGDGYVDGQFVPAVVPPVTPPAAIITQLEFLRRFNVGERIAIRSSTDPIIVDFLHLLSLAQDVRLDDPDVVDGLSYLEQEALLATGRAAEIVAG